MPLFDYTCDRCRKTREYYLPMEHEAPICCGVFMRRLYSGQIIVKMGYPSWVNRIDDIHKAQAERGERLRYVPPSEIF